MFTEKDGKSLVKNPSFPIRTIKPETFKLIIDWLKEHDGGNWNNSLPEKFFIQVNRWLTKTASS